MSFMPWYTAKSFPLGYLQYICDLQEQPRSHQYTAKLETFLLINRRKSIFLWGYFSVSFLFFKKHDSEFEVGTFHWRPNISWGHRVPHLFTACTRYQLFFVFYFLSTYEIMLVLFWWIIQVNEFTNVEFRVVKNF